MENFTIMFSLPAAFLASCLYVLFLVFVVRPRSRLSLWLWWAAVPILGTLAIELLLLATLGTLRSRAVVGPAFYPVHSVLFFVCPPALANLLVLRQRRAVMLWSCTAVLCCTVFGFGSVLLQYAVSEALYGVEGDDGPYSDDPSIEMRSNYCVQLTAGAVGCGRWMSANARRS
jgi:hypothetical protein